jgi:peptidoglycan/xylan/chitin deacetylase (PgdA/CDA1 family)
MNKNIILAYHSLEPSNGRRYGYVSKSQSISVDVFRRQMAWLADKATFVSLDEMISREHSDKMSVCVTFDDGYRDNVILGAPIFEKYKIPITWFVCPKFVIDRSHLPWWDLLDFILENRDEIGRIEIGDWQIDLSGAMRQFRLIARQKFLRDRETRDAFYNQLRTACEACVEVPENAFADSSTIKEAAESDLIELGGHTATHVNAASESPDSLAREVRAGREQLEAWSDQSVNWFAYPYGGTDHISDASREIVRESGFSGAVTTIPGYVHERDENFAIPRWTVPTSWGLAKFKAGVRALHTMRRLGKIKRKITKTFGFSG